MQWCLWNKVEKAEVVTPTRWMQMNQALTRKLESLIRVTSMHQWWLMSTAISTKLTLYNRPLLLHQHCQEVPRGTNKPTEQWWTQAKLLMTKEQQTKMAHRKTGVEIYNHAWVRVRGVMLTAGSAEGEGLVLPQMWCAMTGILELLMGCLVSSGTGGNLQIGCRRQADKLEAGDSIQVSRCILSPFREGNWESQKGTHNWLWSFFSKSYIWPFLVLTTTVKAIIANKQIYDSRSSLRLYILASPARWLPFAISFCCIDKPPFYYDC